MVVELNKEVQTLREDFKDIQSCLLQIENIEELEKDLSSQHKSQVKNIPTNSFVERIFTDNLKSNFESIKESVDQQINTLHRISIVIDNSLTNVSKYENTLSELHEHKSTIKTLLGGSVLPSYNSTKEFLSLDEIEQLQKDFEEKLCDIDSSLKEKQQYIAETIHKADDLYISSIAFIVNNRYILQQYMRTIVEIKKSYSHIFDCSKDIYLKQLNCKIQKELRIAKYNFGIKDSELKHMDEAVRCYTSAIFNPDNRDQYCKEAFEWLLKASNLGNTTAMNNIGDLYYNGAGVAQDYAEAMQWYLKAAHLGDNSAMYNIGYLYENGKGVTQDDKEAMQWYLKAANLKHAPAMNSIGDLYFYGEGVTQNFEEAMQWYLKASDLGNASAMNNIGHLYKNGQGVTQDYKEAMQWYLKASDLGNSAAACNIGDLYYYGKGVILDYKEAFGWFSKSADLGNSSAMNDIGSLYYYGQGVLENYEESFRWYKKSAKLGNIDAMYNLGNLYKNGEGVAQDYNKALRWYSKAAGLGHEGAMEQVVTLKEMLQ